MRAMCWRSAKDGGIVEARNGFVRLVATADSLVPLRFAWQAA
jgi:hypothetical protein